MKFVVLVVGGGRLFGWCCVCGWLVVMIVCVRLWCMCV